MAKGSWLCGGAAGIVVACLAFASPAIAARHPVGDFTPGVVEPPPPGLTLHGDVRWAAPTIASSSALTGSDRQELRTKDGYVVVVETSPGYEPSLAYDEELVEYLDSLLHGSELDGRLVYVAVPREMASICGGQAAACYLPLEEEIAIVGEAEYGGFPTSYVVAHEYGHRIEAYRHNPPFKGGPLAWGTKRWASVKHVCQGYLAGIYAPGNEGARYYRNPGEAFAESYAWYHFGSSVTGWHWYPRLRPNATAYAAIRADVLNPWRPVRSRRRGYIARRGGQRAYVLHPRFDGWLQVRMTGSGDLDLGLYDKRRHLIASSTGDGTSNERINFVVCGKRKLTLVVSAYRPRGRFQLRLKTP